MSIIELFLVAAGLSADAFAVALADGFSLKRRRKGALIAFMFGLFQALMPIAGYFLGNGFAGLISAFDHYIALTVLGFIGAVTFAISLAGVFGGRKFGLLLGAKAELFGGIVLVIIGVKTFLEHIL